MKSENEDVIDTIQLNMELEKVKQYIDILDDREKEVIVGRFGLDLKKEKTQREIAKELGISRSYVSRIEKRALMKMFHEFYRQRRKSGRRRREIMQKKPDLILRLSLFERVMKIIFFIADKLSEKDRQDRNK